VGKTSVSRTHACEDAERTTPQNTYVASPAAGIPKAQQSFRHQVDSSPSCTLDPLPDASERLLREYNATHDAYSLPVASSASPCTHSPYRSSALALTLDVTCTSLVPAPSTPGQFMDSELLERALDHLSGSEEQFMGQFRMLGAHERRHGGQGVVQFALDVRRGTSVAFKFFLNRNSFDCEEAMYSRDDLRPMMPAITLIENNDSVRPLSRLLPPIRSCACASLLICSPDAMRHMHACILRASLQGVAVTEEGWRFPPFIVVERGESLDEWQARIQPDFPTTLQVLSHLVERVSTLHALGVVHRDLKPGNVLWRPRQHSWTLIDFGCAATISMLLTRS
jgi:hypothetical protein